MPDRRITRQILRERRIAFVIADPALRVWTMGGSVELLGALDPPASPGAWTAHDPSTAHGEPSDEEDDVPGLELTTLIPELAGADEVIAGVLSGRLPRYQIEMVNREAPDGGTAYLDLVLLPRRAPGGSIVGLIVVAEDATQRGRREQRITQQHNELQLLRDRLAEQNIVLSTALAELRRVDETRSLFLSVAAHELRSPLSSMLAYLEILLDGAFGALSEPQHRAVEVVQASAERMLKITSDLLDVTRLESGYLEIVLQPTDLAQLAQQVVSELKPRIEARRQQVALLCDAGLPLALCDPARTSQIIGNLLDNAHKYTPDGGQIMIQLDRAAEAGFLRVDIADTGAGIDEEDQRRLFTRFFRTARGPEHTAGGAGLGLYITRSLVELHGGRIWFERRPGGGSIFHLTLPVDDTVARSG